MEKNKLIEKKNSLPCPLHLELIASLERILCFCHTGNTAVLATGLMNPLGLSKGVIKDGFPTLHNIFVHFTIASAMKQGLDVDPRAWPLKDGYPTIASKRAQILTYLLAHFMVSFFLYIILFLSILSAYHKLNFLIPPIYIRSFYTWAISSSKTSHIYMLILYAVHFILKYPPRIHACFIRGTFHSLIPPTYMCLFYTWAISSSNPRILYISICGLYHAIHILIFLIYTSFFNILSIISIFLSMLIFFSRLIRLIFVSIMPFKFIPQNLTQASLMSLK